MAWAKNGTPHTLTGAGTDLDITDLTAKKFNQFLCHTVGTSAVSLLWQFGASSIDTGNNYSHRYNQDGTGDGTQTSRSNIWAYYDSGDDDRFNVVYGINISTEEKLFIMFGVVFQTAGAGTAPQRVEEVGKWVNTSDQFTKVKAFSGSGNHAISSNISAIGTD